MPQWAFVILQWPGSVVCCPCVRLSTISLNNISSETAYWILTKLHRNDPWVVPYKVVQTVPVGCISRSQGQKIGFQNAIFKNLLARNYKAKSFHIWYIASYRGPLPMLFKYHPGDHYFTLIYIMKTSNDIFSLTANGKFDQTSQEWSLGGPLSKLLKSSPTKIVKMVLGQKIGF